jgi:hypothetical protein
MSSLGTVLGDPTSTNSVSYYMGLGGFHIVTKVSNNIDISGYNTDITARWVSRLKK